MTNKIILINSGSSIKESLEILKKSSKKVKFPGLAFIIDKGLKLVGVISNGDLRRLLLKKPNLDLEIDKFVVKKPIFVNDNNNLNQIYYSVKSQFKKRNLSENTSIRCIPILDKTKYLVPLDLSVGQFIYVIRKRLTLAPEKALFLFINNQLPCGADTIGTVYHNHRDTDGFLYINYSGENTFG